MTNVWHLFFPLTAISLDYPHYIHIHEIFFVLILENNFFGTKCSAFIHCLNKRERPLHSEVTSKSKDQSTSFAKCPALVCSRQLVLVSKTLSTMDRFVALYFGFFQN